MNTPDDLDAGYPPERAAIFERLVERTTPPADDVYRCSCDRCRYGPRYTRGESDTAA